MSDEMNLEKSWKGITPSQAEKEQAEQRREGRSTEEIIRAMEAGMEKIEARLTNDREAPSTSQGDATENQLSTKEALERMEERMAALEELQGINAEALAAMEEYSPSKVEVVERSGKTWPSLSWVKWFLLILSGISLTIFSDVYFRVGGHNVGGVNPSSYDNVATVMIVVALFGFFLSD